MNNFKGIKVNKMSTCGVGTNLVSNKILNLFYINNKNINQY